MIDGLRVAVIIPAYRVAGELPEVLSRMPDAIDRVIVVDDASPDDLGRELSRVEDSRLQVIRHETTQGVGGATVTGMLAAMRDDAQIIVKCHGDGQTDPRDIPALVQPIASGWADHVMGSRSHQAKELGVWPLGRLIANIALTFLTKLCSGYWNVLDPVNGFFATRSEVLGRIQLAQLSRRYFFESDLLIRLNIIEARVADVPQPSRHGSEAPLSLIRASFGLPWYLLCGLARRIFWRYLFYDVSPVAAFGIAGLLLATFGFVFGSWQWAEHATHGTAAPLGTILVAAAPLMLGFQLLLQAVILDVANTPRASARPSALIPLSRRPAPVPVVKQVGGAGSPNAAAPTLWARRRADDPPTGHWAAAFQLTPAETRFAFSALSIIAGVLGLFALADLGVRAALRLELRWDTFLYHIPFAALRGGLSIPYELSDRMRPFFEGFPPLAHFVEGALWRLTGSMNATGVVNFLALVGFLAYCQRVLRAPFWLVALISLTAPMVVIHASVSYVDLFGNAFLAAGVGSCVYLFLFPHRATRAVLVGGLVALAGAAWTKFQLVPVAALVLSSLGVVALSRSPSAGLSRRYVALLGVVATLVTAAPYLKNLALYGNPVWPVHVPFTGDMFPSRTDPYVEGASQRPGALAHLGGFATFFNSLFEINHPTSYWARARWNIDQGNATVAFRMGGFWGAAAVTYLVTATLLLVACCRRRGMVVVAGIAAMLGFVALLPQSHELRYYMFIPLSGAAIIGMLFPEFKQIAPRASLGLIIVVMGLFTHMVFENWPHYRFERIDQAMAVRVWDAAKWWPTLERGKTYCAVNMEPMAILLTGPTLSEYNIVDRSTASLCPTGSVIIKH
jgi:dolichol-phosphate mannosyltransferase